MSQYVYTMNRVSKVVPPNRTLIKDVSLSFFPGAKIGVLGLNGAGKSTVLRIMAGEDKEYDGEARPQPGIRIGYLSQEPVLPEDETVREAVMEGVGEVRDLLKRFDEISEKFAEPMSDDEMNDLLAEQAELQDKIDSAGGWELDRMLEVAADALRLPPWESDIKVLSGGERRRVALCRLLLSKPDMLLLDEPTNHLDAESVAWLERFLHDFPGTVMAVTHDRYFLDNVAGWILEMDRGHGIPFQGNYSSWLEQKQARLAVEEKQEASRQKTLKDELEWVRSNAKGRQAKSKARLKQFEELNSKEFQARNETQQIYIPPGPRLGDQVIEVEHLNKAFGHDLLIEDLSFKVPQGAIAGIGLLAAGNHVEQRGARFRRDQRRFHGRSGLRRPEARQPGRQPPGLGRDRRRRRDDPGRQLLDTGAPVRQPFQLQGRRPAKACWPAFRRRAQPRALGQGVALRRQCADARRANE